MVADGTFYYSQLALSTYQLCQLKFRLRYIDGLYWPRPSDEQVEMGQDFHLLSQRYFCTGEIATVSGELEHWIRSLQRFRPLERGVTFLPEQELRLNDGKLRLVAKYDLVVLPEEGKVLIYDWKTEAQKPSQKYLENDLQTIVYCYLMARAGSGYLRRNIAPSDIVMVYWNPRYPESPVMLPYDESRFKRDEEYLRHLIAEIEGKAEDDFWPTSDEEVCDKCEYSSICLGASCIYSADIEPDDLSLSWDDIEDALY